MITIKEVKTKADIKKFVNLQYKLYKGNKNWVPPIKKDEIKALTDENPALSFCDAKFFLAYDDNGKIVGRVGAIINHKYNEKTGKKYVRIYKPEFYDNPEVFDALIQAVEDFGKQNGMELIHGPLGFTNLDTQGLLIEGFEYIQSIASVYHLPYYKDHFDRLGFRKENDWIEFRITLTEEPIKKAMRGVAILKKRYGFTVKNFNSRKELAKYANEVFNILNDAFSELPYVAPFDDKTRDYYINKYFSILNPNFVKIVLKGEELVGFIIGLPSLSEAMQKANGSLYPFGIFPIIKALKHPKVVDLLLTGVKHKYQNTGAAVLLWAELQNYLWERKIYTLETTGIFETNHNVIANWKNFKNIQHKRRRCYVKEIS